MPRNLVRLASTGRLPGRRFLLSFLAIFGTLLTVCGLLLGQAPINALSQAQFGDPAFRSLWERTDGPVASGAVLRGWVWGPVPGQTLSEPFNGLPGNAHQVQYFDKGRMEVNNPNGDKKDPFYVTNGLLDVELISGQQQTGVNSYTYRGPAPINLASDADDPSAPTYQSFNGVSNIPGAPNVRRATAAVGTTVREAIDRMGRTQPWPDNHPDYGVRIAYFEPSTGHNIPDVFWDYLNGQGTIIQDGQQVKGPLFYPWFSVTGYPISEPYWSYVKVGGQYTDVLVQAYERRVLTYVPHLQVGYKVQMGNIGQHYYQWRYINPAQPPPGPGPATPTVSALPVKASLQLSDIGYRKSIIDLNGDQIRMTNTGQAPVSLDGYWIDSPKWDHVDRYYFPGGFTLAPKASVVIHSGRGVNSATDLYMFRTSVMWDGQPYDLAILYDNYGREVTRYFPAAETGPPPTPPIPTPPAGASPSPSPSPIPVIGTGTPTPTQVPGTTVTPVASGTVTSTVPVPTPVSTSVSDLGTPTTTPTTTPTPTRTPNGP